MAIQPRGPSYSYYPTWILDGVWVKTEDDYFETNSFNDLVTKTEGSIVSLTLDGQTFSYDYGVEIESVNISPSSTDARIYIFATSKSAWDSSSVVDLTNTTWLLHENLQPTSQQTTFKLKGFTYEDGAKWYFGSFTIYSLGAYSTYEGLGTAYSYYYIDSPSNRHPMGAFVGYRREDSDGISFLLSKETEKYRTLVITDGDDVTNTDLITWLEANATLLSEPATTNTITYNGTTTEVENGKTATLSCSGKKMKSDLVIYFNEEGSIKYNGTTTEVEKGKTATLSCSGKKMKSDIRIAIDSGIHAEKLATPTNLAIDGTTLTFDLVENATSYEVFADGESIGEYKEE